ncbi:MAG: I78 family peptidase inhibitor [Deltaproteobacteria bacterium]
MKRLLIMLTLAGCTQVEAQVETGDATEESCGLAAVEALVGQSFAAVTVPASKSPVRVIKPGQMVTMDFNPSRLNINVDDAGKITRVWCG